MREQRGLLLLLGRQQIERRERGHAWLALLTELHIMLIRKPSSVATGGVPQGTWVESRAPGSWQEIPNIYHGD